ncbi:KOW domain-containing RNA-binding protein [Papillibacter cinnamivorans]|uniref:Ribosomal protein L14E/L6E/L27E n=1 Tax=Papillibacter cinnamivorans DSM 12816 TaxID=1122930 RepID=A0A1W2BSF0_9FIRM|nr:KOW domain-containing RNA-binding protein [Papillibacter cinnamivorans]SMC75819.1 hypothetical protein SAMN02745168_2343 [Papillibacter cinnamivorans DSM 12816]
MDIVKSHVVVSLAGRDKGKLFLALDTDGEYVLIADGRGRKQEKPKRKKRKHIQFVSESNSYAAAKIRNGEKVLNSEIRKALAEFLGEPKGQD